jgi:hypothetical protein
VRDRVVEGGEVVRSQRRHLKHLAVEDSEGGQLLFMRRLESL